MDIPADMTRKPTNTHIYALEIVTSCTTSRKALRLIERLPAIFSHSVRVLNMFENLPETDSSRPLRLVARCYCDGLRLSRSTIHKIVKMSFKAYVQLPGIFDCSVMRLNLLKDRRSPPHNRYCSCDLSRSLRLVVRSSKGRSAQKAGVERSAGV